LTVYLDTSAAVALFVPEPKTPAIAAWFAANADPLVAADWIVTELASALAIKERRGDLEAEQALAVWQEFSAICGTGLRLVPVTRAAFAAAAELVRDARTGLRAGDALHLAVAREVGAAEIATLDATLAANAESKGVRPILFADP